MIVVVVVRWPNSDELYQIHIPETASQNPITKADELIIALDQERRELRFINAELLEACKAMRNWCRDSLESFEATEYPPLDMMDAAIAHTEREDK
jgi:hypothetical protein